VAETEEEPQKERTPSLDQAGVLAYLKAPNGGRAILEHLELPSQPGRLAPAQGPPQSAWC